ncbi:hypothetical protein [Escherichia coli]|uniref:hypothetical protein n=1 Tax=Escherichia coli TaxID=562 RepID=UPI00180AEC42|nr:hypothetical protein [Escherichia coli]EFJ9880882.1 hypothetical protein [Escherichia coli]MCZ0390521.1 hypothetical protein [Escherichia coli]
MVQRLFFLILGIAVAYVPFFLIGLAIGHWMDLPMKESSSVVGSVGVFLVGVGLSSCPTNTILAIIGYGCAVYSGAYF